MGTASVKLRRFMSTIDPTKKVQKVRTEEEMQNALANFCVQKHTLTVPPQIDDEDIVLSDAIEELLETRKLLASFDTTPYEKLSDEQKVVVNNFRARISDILIENLEPFYKEHPDLVFGWSLALNVFLREDKQEMQEL
jgi:hypothetical protein